MQALLRSSGGGPQSVVDSWLDKAAAPLKVGRAATTSVSEVREPASADRVKPTRQVSLASAPKGSVGDSIRLSSQPTKASVSWRPSLRESRPDIATCAKLRARPQSEARASASLGASRSVRSPSPVRPKGLSPREGDSASTEWTDSELEIELLPGEPKLTRGLKRQLYIEFKEGKRFPRQPSTKPPASLVNRRPKEASPSREEFSCEESDREPSRSHSRQPKEAKRDRRDSRTRQKSPARGAREPAPGQGKHFGKNKGRRKRERYLKKEGLDQSRPSGGHAPRPEEAGRRQAEGGRTRR